MRRKLVIAAVALVIAGIASCLAFNAHVDRRWREARRIAKERLAAARAAAPRPVLRGGDPDPGSAWDHYPAAVNACKLLGTRADWLGWHLDGTKDWNGEPVRPRAAAIVEERLAAIDALRRGVRCGRGMRVRDWESGLAVCSGSISGEGAFRLSRAASCRALFLADEGRAGEAAELLLDTLQFARDIGEDADFYDGVASREAYKPAFLALRHLLLSGRLTPGELAQIARELEIIDRGFTTRTETVTNQLRIVLAEWMREAWADWLSAQGVPGRLPAYGFSMRFMAADAIPIVDDLVRRGVEASRPPWPEARLRLAALSAEAKASSNPLVAALDWPGGPALWAQDLEVRAELRLLRAAAHRLSAGAWPELDDPFGAKLRSDARSAWSVGPDGVDGTKDDITLRLGE